ncbi:hypothetical protein AB0M12_20700 [Nocardia vinacea]|uniref:hypothetical protein n=1 Tax=Nocardia vinacea TaxID=96468 RepID=UPI003419A6CF
MDSLNHPAVTVALDALADADRDLFPVSVLVREDLVAVVIDGGRGRYIVFVHPDGDSWDTHGITFGASRPEGPREDRTSAHQPLQRYGTRFRSESADRDGVGWFAVIGRAAHDAESVRVVSTLEERVASIGADGLAFAVVRATGGEKPQVSVNTRDGRWVPAGPLVA